MLVLEVERNGEWTAVVWTGPGDRPSAISDRTDGTRHVIYFQCHGDHSVIRRHRFKVSQSLEYYTPADGDIVARLHHGQTHEITLQTDGMAHPARWRFRHQDDDTGDRAPR